MSEELLKAIEEFDYEETGASTWKIHYNPEDNGSISQIGPAGQTTSKLPFIIVDENIATDFIKGKRYQREYHVKDGVIELKAVDMTWHEVSDKKVNQLGISDDVTPGTYFITVKGDPDLIIDTVLVTSDNLESEAERIKEYLVNNDVFKDQ